MINNQPTIESACHREWQVEGKRHRDDGPALIVDGPDGSWIHKWCRHDKLHRDDGPAVEFSDGAKFWYVDNKRHNIAGPAVMFADGELQWWVHGRQIECKDDSFMLKESSLTALRNVTSDVYHPQKPTNVIFLDMGSTPVPCVHPCTAINNCLFEIDHI